MFDLLKKLKYGARVFLSRKGGQEETIDLHGRATVLRHGGDGPPFVYLHSTLGESLRWLPFHNAWSRDFTVYAPLHPGFGTSGGFDQIGGIEDMAFHYVEMLDALGLEQVILGGVSLGGWIAAEFAVRWPERVKCLWLSGARACGWRRRRCLTYFALMRDTDALRRLLFHDPDGYMAQMLLGGPPDEERMMQAYQSLTVLARLMWERPYDPQPGGEALPYSVSDALVVGRRRPAGAAGLWGSVQKVSAAGGVETDPAVRPPGDVREGAGVRGSGDAFR